MALGKRRTRQLTVSGQGFRWRCDFNDRAEMTSVAWSEGRISSPDQLIIRPEAVPHASLIVSWPPCSGPIVTPCLVEACIKVASDRGWPTQHTILQLNGNETSFIA